MVKRQSTLAGFLTPSGNRVKSVSKQKSNRERITIDKLDIRRSKRQAENRSNAEDQNSLDNSDVTVPRKNKKGVNLIPESPESSHIPRYNGPAPEGQDESFSIDDRSLTELMATGPDYCGNLYCTAEPDVFTPTVASSPQRGSEDNDVIEDLRIYIAALNNQIDLLNGEMEVKKKVDKRHKSEIKRLTNDNDQLRRQISRYRGMRKYTDSKPTCSKPTPTSRPSSAGDRSPSQMDKNKLKPDADIIVQPVNACDNHSVHMPSNPSQVPTNKPDAHPSQEQIDTVSAKLASLRSHMTDIAQKLWSAAQDDDTMAVPRSSDCNARKPDVPTPPASTYAEVVERTTSQISVVELGRHGTSNVDYHDYGQRPSDVTTSASRSQRPSDVTKSASRSQRNPPKDDDVYVIGTSLTRELGFSLAKKQVKSTVFTYAGSRIANIRDRVPHIFPRDNASRTVILQVAGNDAEVSHPDRVIDEYEGLIKDVKRVQPNAKIVLSIVPPRKPHNRVLKQRIDAVNSYLRDRALLNDNVHVIDVAPTSFQDHFDKGKLHFNADGLEFYAENIKRALSNFHRSETRPVT